jgi:hypothetical protein
VIAIAILVVERPKTASISLLALYTGLLLERLIILSNGRSHSMVNDISSIIVGIAALIGIFVQLNTPLRDPGLPNEEISPVFTAPTVKLRTPEDNLTP